MQIHLSVLTCWGPILCVLRICARDGLRPDVNLVDLGHRMMLLWVLWNNRLTELHIGVCEHSLSAEAALMV